MTTDFEKCVELAQQRLKDIITAANKADPEEMRALLCSSIANELPTKSKWCLDKSCLIIDKYEFTIEEFIQYDAKTTDRYCLFGPMPNRYLPNNEENEQLYEKPAQCVLSWTGSLVLILAKTLKCLKRKPGNISSTKAY